ncbi:hypothetical protein HMPREF9371_0082 [Neisseria shayeganii 871]|uniref:Uncharacterized protein n=1 Tax=Neisseria shayeganii 871 TaxID=1032488 RepID=G4CEP3_9NEIS|nr:hypothetical protein HMPREF9371_0082 [Neisseria shayeganii 871]
MGDSFVFRSGEKSINQCVTILAMEAVVIGLMWFFISNKIRINNDIHDF